MDKDEILGIVDRQVKTIRVESWNKDVFIRTWTGAERDRVNKRCKLFSDEKNEENLAAFIVRMSLCAENGEEVFKDGDVKAISGKAYAALEYISDQALQFNGIDTAKIEDAEKN